MRNGAEACFQRRRKVIAFRVATRVVSTTRTPGTTIRKWNLMNFVRYPLLVALSCMFSLSAHAQGTVPIIDPVAPTVGQAAVAASGDYWLEVEHRSGVISIDRYGSDGRLGSRDFLPETGEWSRSIEVPELLPQPDGSSLGGGPSCDVWRFGADGRLKFRSRALHAETNSHCRYFAQSASGDVWLAEFQQSTQQMRLRRLDAAGRDLGPVEPDPLTAVNSNLLAVPDSESVRVGTHTLDGRRHPSVAEIRPDGSRAREWVAPAEMRDAPIVNLLPGADGALIAIGGSHLPGIWIGLLAPSGTAQWRLLDPQLTLDPAPRARVEVNGRVALLVRGAPGVGRSFLLLDANLQVSGRFDLPPGMECVVPTAQCGLQFQANGQWQVLLLKGVDGILSLHLLRISPVGAVLSDQRIPDIGIPDEIDALPAGGWLVSRFRLLHRVNTNGTVQALQPTQDSSQSATLLGEYRLGGERYAGFGSEYGMLFARLDDAGQVLWQHRFLADAEQDQAWSDRAVQIVGGQVCMFDERGAAERPPLRCFDRSSGRLRFEHDFGFDPPEWAGFANGILVYIDYDANAALLLRRRNLLEDRELGSITVPFTHQSTVRLRADLVTRQSVALIGIQANQSHHSAAVLDENDAALRLLPIGDYPREFFLLRDRVFLLRLGPGQASGALALQVIDLPSGSQVFAAELAAAVSRQRWSHRVALGSDRLYVGVTGLPASTLAPADRARVLAMPLNGSRIDWQRDLPYDTDSLRDLASVPARNALLVTGGGNGAVQLSLLNAATGSPVEQRALPCGGSQCWFRPISLGNPVDRYHLLVSDYGSRTGRKLRNFDIDLRNPANLPAGQPGVTGAWYSPASSGQGFVLSWLPGSNTLFAPWFTYRGAVGDGEEGLSWYSLQGTATPQSGSVTLQILRNRGGRFAQPPITTSEVVGSATLRFTDCDRASLAYRFNADVEGGKGRVVPWVRIGARVHPCRDAAGALHPPQLAVTDTAGFSTRQSGAWYNPATSGQGLMLEVVPADSAQAGLLFGAWFSYDPEVPANDPTAQDWLVLQGTLAGAQAGRVDLPILRVIGGTLDGLPTGNLFPIGIATIHFSSCERASLEFAFNDDELAAEHAGRRGSMELERIGGCGN